MGLLRETPGRVPDNRRLMNLIIANVEETGMNANDCGITVGQRERCRQLVDEEGSQVKYA